MFKFDEELFNNSLTMTKDSYNALILLFSDIQSLEQINDFYEGRTLAIDACNDLKNIEIKLKGLMLDMLRTAKIAKIDVLDNSSDIMNLLASSIMNKIMGYNLEGPSNETFLEILNSLNLHRPFKLFNGLEITYNDKQRILHFLKNKQYEKLILELLYFTEQEQYDNLNDRYKYVNARIADIDNKLTDYNFYKEINAYKLFLEDYKDSPDIKNYKLLLDDREISFDSYEEGMNYINNIINELKSELDSLNEEKVGLEEKINNFDFKISKVYDYNNGIDLVSNDGEAFQKLLESLDVIESGLYDQVFNNKNKYPSNQPINFFLDNKNPVGGYGCDQGIFKEMDLDDPEYLRLKDKLVNEYGFSKADATKCIQLVDYEGACSYAAIIDSLLETMYTNPQVKEEIETKSGIKLYNEDGDLNTAEFLLDFFVHTNTHQNGGELFYQDDEGNYHVYEDIEITPPVEKAGEVEFLKSKSRNEKVVSTAFGSDEEKIQSYLYHLSPNLKYESENILSSGYDDPFIVEKKVMRLIDEGKTVRIGIHAMTKSIYFQNFTSDERQIKFKSVFFDKDKNFKGNTYSGGHAVNIVGYDYDGVIIDTWGGFYKISWEDVATTTIHVCDEKITLNEN